MFRGSGGNASARPPRRERLSVVRFGGVGCCYSLRRTDSTVPADPTRHDLMMMALLLRQIHYHDQLMMDMGEARFRKCWLLSELFMPYEAGDYDGVISTGPAAPAGGAPHAPDSNEAMV